MKIGVLALQGAFREHRKMIEQCGVEAREIRTPGDLDSVDGLIIPGGESTAIGKLMTEWGLADKIIARNKAGMHIYGTCAGLILLARDIVGSTQPRLGLMDITVYRNAYGRQRESFEADLDIRGIGPGFKAVFIRAPYIEKAGPGVEILAKHDGKIVMARQGNILVSAFHPELTDDNRIHRYFLDMVQKS